MAIETDAPYKAFSGADVVAHINGERAGTLQALTVSITRETAPIYVMGDANPRAFVRGKRGIAGSLIFSQFDKHAILRQLFKPQQYGQTLADVSRLFRTTYLGNDAVVSHTAGFDDAPGYDGSILMGGPDNDAQSAFRRQVQDIYSLVARRKVNYVDQLPAMDITVTLVNEEGDAAVTTINGVTLINEGWGFTLDDLTSEVAFTYMARSVTPLTSLTDKYDEQVGNVNYTYLNYRSVV